jgi:hypothetical protein
MSFDIFLNAFSNGETALFDHATLKVAFGPEAIFDDDLSKVSFPDGSGGDIYGTEDPEIANLMFNHCGGDAFFDGLLQLARQTNGIIFWPSEPPIAVAPSEEALIHVQPEFLEAFEQVKIADTAAELRALIENS